MVFRALTTEPELLELLRDVPHLPSELQATVDRRVPIS